MANEIIVEKTSNGYILKNKYLYEVNDKGVEIYLTETEVIEEQESDEKECLKRLLERVAETLGFVYDKYGKENISITFDRKGSKVER
jgi:hypothetical protein